MAKDPITKDQVMEKFESIYQDAYEEGKWSVALRAAEMQAKALGMFMKPKRLPDIVRIADMSEEQLSEFIDRMEARHPEFKNMEAPTPETSATEEGEHIPEVKAPEAPAIETGSKDGENNSSEFKNTEPPTPETGGKEGGEHIPEVKTLEAPPLETSSKSGESNSSEFKDAGPPTPKTNGTGRARPGELQMLDRGPSLKGETLVSDGHEKRNAYIFSHYYK